MSSLRSVWLLTPGSPDSYRDGDVFCGIVGLCVAALDKIGYCCFTLLGAAVIGHEGECPHKIGEDLFGAGLEQGAEHFEVSGDLEL